MITHDVLAYAVAAEAVRRVRASEGPWKSIFSAETYVTSSRVWPMPDFVLLDRGNGLTAGVEFKPPRQSKREYLTGLGQALAYSKDFNYGILVLPSIADDGYRIGEHVRQILQQPALSDIPVGVLQYDPAHISPHTANFEELVFFQSRNDTPQSRARVDNSFYAKWREMSPDEAFRYISYSYDEGRAPASSTGTVRDRAFIKLWDDIQRGDVRHWGGDIRHYTDTQQSRTAYMKNYRNFIRHINWTDSVGNLTEDGLKALHVGSLYGAGSRPFLDTIAKAVLLAGKHLILFNAISDYQDGLKSLDDEQEWLEGLEAYMEDKGFLKRNQARADAAIAQSAREFLKAEKQLWRQLELIVPRIKGRKNLSYHQNRGIIFNWSRITDLLQGSA